MKVLPVFLILWNIQAEVIHVPPEKDHVQFLLSKLDDRIKHLKNRAASRFPRVLNPATTPNQAAFRADNQFLAQGFGSITQANNSIVWGFGWKDGKYVRCPENVRLHTILQINSRNETRYVPALFNRNERRRKLSRQMQCTLYARIVRVVRYHLVIHEVVLEFRSNCKRSRFFKIFTGFSRADRDHDLHRIRLRIQGATFEIYFNADASKMGNMVQTPWTGGDNWSRYWSSNWQWYNPRIQGPISLVRYKLARPFWSALAPVFKPLEIFQNTTYYMNETEYGQNVANMQTIIANQTNRNNTVWIDWRRINSTFDVVPKSLNSPLFTSQDMDNIWAGANPQECPMTTLWSHRHHSWSWFYMMWGEQMNCNLL